MSRNDDITDALDDSELRSTIEAAEQRGLWRSDPSSFDAPKVRALALKLAQAPRETYSERRLQELQRRIAAKESDLEPPKTALFQDQVAPLEQAFMAASSPDDWREPSSAERATGPTPASAAPMLPLSRVESPFSALLACLRCLAAASAVFALAAIVQGLPNGWTVSLGARSTIAAGLAGLTWYLANAGRFRSAAIGIGIHLLAFLGDTQTGDPTQILATLLGMLIVLFGSGAVGFMNEARSSTGRR